MSWNPEALRKSSLDRWISGVCGGLGEHTPLPAWLWRALFLIFAFVGGYGVVAYLVLWLLMPAQRFPVPARTDPATGVRAEDESPPATEAGGAAPPAPDH